MKKFATVSALFILSVFFLLSCGQEKTYDEGFEDGYDMGYYDARVDFEDDYARGYEDGYSEGYWMGSDEFDHECDWECSIENAYDYVREMTGWSVYEAWNTIQIYHDGVDPDGYALPTKEEYRQCVDTLVLFCEYIEGELP